MLVAGALAFGLATTLVWLLSGPWLARLVLDMPNERSLHNRPIPRTGGIGLFFAAAVTWLFAASMGGAGPQTGDGQRRS